LGGGGWGGDARIKTWGNSLRYGIGVKEILICEGIAKG